ncbi:AraC-like DNA-binding protein [Aquimarina sp. MAR_2010_214]|uniref:helix-turn-helix domain-containing protein n=1 Tax=Aquimarina sp. MAR_2010_214 TaxID=1250026 RepID=UPI000C702E10|nr:AraC family transcriptional regulator [Aquimarina sp. MAR_2010_214]PKV48564.1 AraC-like DNA-binding protein [Aquimarina sp. MAR_2010_214]
MNNEIIYSITSPRKWQEILHKNTFSKLEGKKLILQEKSGRGTIDVVNIQEGLAITFIDITLSNSLKLKRIATKNNDHFILNFYFSSINIKEQIGTMTQLLGFEFYSIMLYSSMTESESIIPANIPVKVFNITFSKEWLYQNVLDTDNKTDNLQQFFSAHGPIYLYENLDFKFNAILKDITQSSENINKISLFSNVLQLLVSFFKKIEARSTIEKDVYINPIDLQNLLRVRELIEQNWQEKPSNKALAEQANMSLSKFKQLFKHIFGDSPYQYYLNFKMGKALELLQKKEYSISDIGYIVGYSNLSQFSKIFKKKYNFLPSEVNNYKA